MTALLVLAGYAVGWAACTLVVARITLERDARRTAARRRMLRLTDGEPLVDGEDRGMAVMMGGMVGMVWPAALVAGLLYLAVRPLLTTRAERDEADRRELEAYRALAREHGLPAPEIPEKGSRA